MADPALVGISADTLPDTWPIVRPFVDAACGRSNGKFEAADILRALIARDMQLWAVETGGKIEAVLITRIVVYPRKKSCEILVCVGEVKPASFPLLDQIEAWAKAQGCSMIEPIARKGWERPLKSRGYRATHVILAKDL